MSKDSVRRNLDQVGGDVDTEVQLIKKQKTISSSTDTDDGGEGPSSGVKSGYSKYFKYDKRGEQSATCLLCENMKKIKILKMKGGNTSSLKKHLLAAHKPQYQKLFGQNVPKNQPTLEQFKQTKKVSI